MDGLPTKPGGRGNRSEATGHRSPFPDTRLAPRERGAPPERRPRPDREEPLPGPRRIPCACGCARRPRRRSHPPCGPGRYPPRTQRAKARSPLPHRSASPSPPPWPPMRLPGSADPVPAWRSTGYPGWRCPRCRSGGPQPRGSGREASDPRERARGWRPAWTPQLAPAKNPGRRATAEGRCRTRGFQERRRRTRDGAPRRHQPDLGRSKTRRCP